MHNVTLTWFALSFCAVIVTSDAMQFGINGHGEKEKRIKAWHLTSAIIQSLCSCKCDPAYTLPVLSNGKIGTSCAKKLFFFHTQAKFVLNFIKHFTWIGEEKALSFQCSSKRDKTWHLYNKSSIIMGNSFIFPVSPFCGSIQDIFLPPGGKCWRPF